VTGSLDRHLATTRECDRLTRFLEALRLRGRRAATLEAYDKDWRALARWYAETTGRSFDLTRFTPLLAVDYVGFLSRTCKPATVARRILFFRTYAAEAYRARELDEDVFTRIQRLWAPKPPPAAPCGLTAEEARDALRKVGSSGSPRDKAIVFAFLLTGIRVGELAALDRGDLESEEPALRLRAEIAMGRREREVSLPAPVADHLREYLQAREDDSAALFVGQRGRMTPSGIRDVVARYAGVPPRRLRHTFAYEYLRSNNNDLIALADVLGHASLDTTRGYARRREAPAPPEGAPGFREALARLLGDNAPPRPRPLLVGQEVLVDPGNAAVCKVKGILFVARQRFVREMFGEDALRDVLGRLSPATRACAERPEPTSWYEFQSLMEYDRALYDQFHARHPEVLVMLGAASAEYSNLTLGRVLEDERLAAFLEGVVHLHGQYQKYGRAVFTRTARGGQMACYDYPVYSPLYCASALGFFWEALLRHGARDARVVESKCHCRGDGVCLYELEWS
jgi:site-specific recombinase XerD